MGIRTSCTVGLFGLALFLFGCGSSSSSATSADAGPGEAGVTGTPPGPAAACQTVVSRADCDKTLRPIVFVHGTYSSGTDIEHMAALFGSNGYCQDRIVAVDYDSVPVPGAQDSPGAACTSATPPPKGCDMIDKAIDAVLAANPGFTQVDLMGHSQGTSHCSAYLVGPPAQAAKVAHYINFSGSNPVGNTQTLSLSSMNDLGGTPHHACTGTTACTGSGMPAGANLTTYTLTDQDHFGVAASKDSFVQVYTYLTGKAPTYTDIQCGDDPVMVSGKGETFADNVPINGMITISEVGTSPREGGAPMVVMSGSGSDGGTGDGSFGPIALKRNVQYVFTGYDSSGKLVGWQYFTPFKRDNDLIRLLSPASASADPIAGATIAGQSTDHDVTSPKNTLVIARWAQGGIRQDLGASLKINGVEALDSANSGASAKASANLQGGVAALFLEDTNKNGKSDLGLPYSTTFISFTDFFIDATSPGFVDMTFTAGSEDPVTVDVPIAIGNYPSSEGLVSVMFQ